MPETVEAVCVTTVEELRDVYHPRATGYYINFVGLVGFKTAKTVYRRKNPGSPRSVRSLSHTITWYALDDTALCYERVGTSKSAAAWAQYYRLPRRRRVRG